MEQQNQKRFVGSWINTASGIQGDEIEQQIERMLHEQLTHVVSTADGWTQLFVDKATGQHWELTFPQGHLQGGGPRTLTAVTLDQSQGKYQN